jgi:IS4 transposase
MLIDLLEGGHKFICRLSSVHFKEGQKNMPGDDCIVEIAFTMGRISAAKRENPEAARKMADVGSIKLRFMRLRLPNGDEKVVATNLNCEEFTAGDISVLYQLRWGIETVYDDLKNKLEIENFIGTKADIIMQDIYATMFLSNLVNDMCLESTENIDQKNTNIQCKSTGLTL